MIGCDIRNMTDETKKILTNKEVLRVDQDAAYRQPFFLNSMPYEPNKDRGPGEAFWNYYPLDCPIMARFLDDGEIALGDRAAVDVVILPVRALYALPV